MRGSAAPLAILTTSSGSASRLPRSRPCGLAARARARSRLPPRTRGQLL